MEEDNKIPSTHNTDLPPHTKVWLDNTLIEDDCFFIVGEEEDHNERIGAKRTFLMGYSEPFQRMLGKSELAENGDITLTDTDPHTFKNLLKLVYGGSNVTIKRLSLEESSSLLYLLEKYLFSHFKPKLTKHMAEMMSLENVFVALMNPVCLLQEELKKAVAKVVCEKTEQILKNKLFLQIDSDCLLFIVKLASLNTAEIRVWEAVIKWGKNMIETGESKSLRDCIGEHLKHIHLDKISSEDFVDKVVPAGVLEPVTIAKVLKKHRGYDKICCTVGNGETVATIAFSLNEVSTLRGQFKRFLLQNLYCNVLVEKFRAAVNHFHEEFCLSVRLEFEDRLQSRSPKWHKLCIEADMIIINFSYGRVFNGGKKTTHYESGSTVNPRNSFCLWKYTDGFSPNDILSTVINIKLPS